MNLYKKVVWYFNVTCCKTCLCVNPHFIWKSGLVGLFPLTLLKCLSPTPLHTYKDQGFEPRHSSSGQYFENTKMNRQDSSNSTQKKIFFDLFDPRQVEKKTYSPSSSTFTINILENVKDSGRKTASFSKVFSELLGPASLL